MKLKDYKKVLAVVFIVGLLTTCSLSAQNTIAGKITNSENGDPIANVEVYDNTEGLLTVSAEDGTYSITSEQTELKLIFFAYEYKVKEVSVVLSTDQTLNVSLQTLGEELSEVEIFGRNTRVFELRRLKDVEETSIFAGKKTEVILVEQSMANLATNNARQIYSQIAGLNIFQNDDAGLQLNIGGRGLDPRRTSNFNTRQNGYDISADVLGYPESYYAPPAEILSEIQIVRGAASLQYGTQFGGLINFKFKGPNPNEKFDFLTRNTTGSFGLYTNYTSVNGTLGKFSYYTFFNYKKGDGFRPNSEFESKNAFVHLGYRFSEKTSITGEVTYLRYLAQQAGGLTDTTFANDAFQSNRTRNWFQVDWLLYNIKLAHQFSAKTNFTFNLFGLDAQRNALGFRTNRQDQPDDINQPRDLQIGDFKNFGFEARLLSSYKLFNKEATGLIGTKFYKADNVSIQGPGSAASNPNFDLQLDDFPNYPSQSNFDNPNLNIALFGENIIYLNDKWSVTPGFRLEYIKTESDGFFKRINLDGAGNVILNETMESYELNERTFVLLGLGASYKKSDALEFYANASQNYRSVTFSDINITNPALKIDEDINDEKGFTADFGVRGRLNNTLSFDANIFGLFYNDRIGLVLETQQDNSVKNLRTNVGDAVIFGLESLIDVNLNDIILKDSDFKFNYFLNTAVITSEYVRSDQSGIEGNEVEFVPLLNLKTGLRFAYKNLQASAQYTYLSEQFSDASNALEDPSGVSGIVGPIPAYDVLDISLSYRYKNFKVETGLNNVLDNTYFTRRATGYPGPGIIPSPPRNWFVTLQISL